MSKFSLAFVQWLNGFAEAIGEDALPTREQWKTIKDRCRDEAINGLEE